VGAEPIGADRRVFGRMDITKLLDAFTNMSYLCHFNLAVHLLSTDLPVFLIIFCHGLTALVGLGLELLYELPP
jgi:hypothetical protein